MKRSILLSLVACLLGAFTVGAIGTAATSKKRSTRTTTTTASGPPPTLKEAHAEREAERDARLKKVADALSVSLADLKSALTGVRNDQLDADVKANRLTQAQADAIKACDAEPLTCDRSNLPAYGHRGGGAPGKDRDAFYEAVAKKLGKETADVKKAFQDNMPTRGKRHGRGGPGFGHGGPGGPPPGP